MQKRDETVILCVKDSGTHSYLHSLFFFFKSRLLEFVCGISTEIRVLTRSYIFFHKMDTSEGMNFLRRFNLLEGKSLMFSSSRSR